MVRALFLSTRNDIGLGARCLTAWANKKDTPEADAGALLLASGIDLLRAIAIGIGAINK